MLEEGDIAALYTRYGHALFKRCLQLTRSPQDAEELLQETFCQFFEGRARFEGRAAPFTFLYRIATNLSIDRLRRRATRERKAALDGAEAAGDGGPHRHVQALEELAMATQGLDQETLTIAVMAHVDGLTQEEIAEALELSRRTVGKRLQQFLDQTRGAMGVSVTGEERPPADGRRGASPHGAAPNDNSEEPP